MKISDLVKYECPTTGEDRLGFVTDIFEWSDERKNHCMFEVVCTDPPDRGWHERRHLEVISSTGDNNEDNF
mgnify:CR=1 FL=1|jgi:hypothetical protein|tara:strand:- start:991 stop:1203 length:213 start_codon:yes stop_codon:yes gene_type:complete